jgi:hypothetical protein
MWLATARDNDKKMETAIKPFPNVIFSPACETANPPDNISIYGCDNGSKD